MKFFIGKKVVCTSNWGAAKREGKSGPWPTKGAIYTVYGYTGTCTDEGEMGLMLREIDSPPCAGREYTPAGNMVYISLDRPPFGENGFAPATDISIFERMLSYVPTAA